MSSRTLLVGSYSIPSYPLTAYMVILKYFSYKNLVLIRNNSLLGFNFIFDIKEHRHGDSTVMVKLSANDLYLKILILSYPIGVVYLITLVELSYSYSTISYLVSCSGIIHK